MTKNGTVQNGRSRAALLHRRVLLRHRAAKLAGVCEGADHIEKRFLYGSEDVADNHGG
jgi:hypothetical protein